MNAVQLEDGVAGAGRSDELEISFFPSGWCPQPGRSGLLYSADLLIQPS